MIRTLLFSTLYPSSVRPSHGIFVKMRIVAPCWRLKYIHKYV